MVINKAELNLEPSEPSCDSTECKNPGTHHFGDFTFCAQCYDRATAMSWRPLKELGYDIPLRYDIPSPLAAYYL